MATLVVTDGPCTGQKFALAGCRVAMLGRDAACSFQIVDPELSRHHLQIRYAEDQGKHFVNDFQSKNGVFVNGKKIEQETVLLDCDVIAIGGSKIVYTTQDVQDAQRVVDAWKRSGQGHLRTQTDT
jgi:pSer/pThr/pTyr-binding forkhead associated (FHA) protein